MLTLDIELDIDEPPRADPWNSYYAARFAWNDAGCDTFRSVGATCQRTEAGRLEAPHFVELRGGKTRTTILTGGLPYHRRVGMRKLDCLLAVRGEEATKFRLAIGIDLPQPMPAAMELLSPVVTLAEKAAPPRNATSSWLCRLDTRNVLATHWEPLLSKDGAVQGLRARLLESQGRPVRACLEVFRPIESAQQVDFHGETLAQLSVEEGRVMIDFSAYEWVELEARW